jgi:hypothetical protein
MCQCGLKKQKTSGVSTFNLFNKLIKQACGGNVLAAVPVVPRTLGMRIFAGGAIAGSNSMRPSQPTFQCIAARCTICWPLQEYSCLPSAVFGRNS